MADLFPILPPDPGPPRFDAAVRDAVSRLESVLHQFDLLLTEVSDDVLTPEELAVVEKATMQVEVAAEMAEEGYVAAAYDGHAWYRIMENLEQAANRLESANGIMQSAAHRLAPSGD